MTEHQKERVDSRFRVFLDEKIGHLEEIERTSEGDHALIAYSNCRNELDRFSATPQDPDEESEGLYDFSEQDALERAAEDIEHLEQAGVREWSELLTGLRDDGWVLAPKAAVLSPEEAKLAKECIAFAIESCDFKTKVADEELRDRLKAYAAKGTQP